MTLAIPSRCSTIIGKEKPRCSSPFYQQSTSMMRKRLMNLSKSGCGRMVLSAHIAARPAAIKTDRELGVDESGDEFRRALACVLSSRGIARKS